MKGKNFIKKLIFTVLLVGLGIRFLGPLGIRENRPREKDFYLSDSYVEIEDIFSEYAIVVNRDSGEIVMGKNHDQRIHPASMTKVMTAIVALENLDSLKEKVQVSQESIDYAFRNGLSRSGFEAGEKPRAEDLVYGLLLESGGEAALSLQDHVEKSRGDFIGLMNNKLKDLGLSQTNFSNTTGMTDENNYTSPRDMAEIFRYSLRNKDFYKIVTSKDHEVSSFNNKRTLVNNLFYNKKAMDINKDYIKCGKTGYTEAAGLCLVSLGQTEKAEYIVVTAKAKGDGASEQFNLRDTEKIYKKLIELGY